MPPPENALKGDKKAAICLHWFNPLVWLMSREVNRACELSCDEAVIRLLNDQERRAYGDTLLHAIKNGGGYHSFPGSVTLSENAKLMKERLKAIMNFKKNTKLTTAFSLLLALTLTVGAAVVGAYTDPGGGIPPNYITGDGTSILFTREEYYQAPYLFELGWNVYPGRNIRGEAAESCASAEILLPDGTSLTVLFQDSCRYILEDAKTLEALTDLLAQLHDNELETEFPLTHPLIFSAEDIGDDTPAVPDKRASFQSALPNIGENAQEPDDRRDAEYLAQGINRDANAYYYQGRRARALLNPGNSTISLQTSPNGSTNIKTSGMQTVQSWILNI